MTTALPGGDFEVLCDECERRLLTVPANQAATELQDGWLSSEQKRVARELEQQCSARMVDETLAQQARELAAANAELRHLIDAIPQSITILAPDGRTVGANAFVLEYSGLTLEEVRADEARVRRVHPDDVARFAEERRKALALGEPFEAEQRARRKDGQYRWFLVRYNPVRDADDNIIRWYATGTDIDDRKQAEDRMHSENLALREEVDRSSMFEEIVGISPVLGTVLSHVSRVALTDSTVLITGETGTGKELIARAIHKRSPRSARPFVAVNCAATPSSLIASELFGHEKGAFTGALHRRQGRFELADGGTIFLDEVGELPCETQIMLLRVLQEREFERVGGVGPIRVNVRVIAATNRDLLAAIAGAPSARTCFIGSTSSHWTCRPCANAGPIFLSSSSISSIATPSASASGSVTSLGRRLACFSRTTGRGTSASCRTSSSAR